MRVNTRLVSELNGLNEPTRQFFSELATRDFLLQEKIMATNGELALAVEGATSVRSVQRWITYLAEAGLLNRRKIRIRADRFRRELTLSENGIRAQAKLLSQEN